MFGDLDMACLCNVISFAMECSCKEGGASALPPLKPFPVGECPGCYTIRVGRPEFAGTRTDDGLAHRKPRDLDEQIFC